jgi:hypothetical protein
MATPKKRPRVPRPPHAAWRLSELPPCLSDVARKSLIEANRHFNAERHLDELDEQLRVIMAPATLGLDQSHKARRDQLEELREAGRHFRELMDNLHPRSRDLFWGTLFWLRESKDAHDLIRALPESLAVFDRVARWALDDIPGAGRSTEGRRAEVIRAVDTWLAALSPLNRSKPRLLRRDEPPARRERSVRIVCDTLEFDLEQAINTLKEVLHSKQQR